MESRPPPDWRDERGKRCYWITRIEISQEKLEPKQGSPPSNKGDGTIVRDAGWFLPSPFHSPTIVTYFQKPAGIQMTSGLKWE